MKGITSKAVLKNHLRECLRLWDSKNPKETIQEFHDRILSAKARFPLLEYSGDTLFKELPYNLHLAVCNQIHNYQTIGGNVVIGTILKHRLESDFIQTISSARHYISQGEEWYVSDIIGERVYGRALLRHFGQALPALQELSWDTSTWVVRSVGAGSHYAIKKGLSKVHSEKVFQLLLSLGLAQNYHVKTGIGWAAKTASKFHPKMVLKYQDTWKNRSKTGKWFQTKVEIGLKRHEYAQGNQG